MKVYHASSVVVDIPNTSHSREHLDFGKGFYVTTLEHQAVEYGQRFLRRGRKAWLNVYDLSEEFGDLNVISKINEIYTSFGCVICSWAPSSQCNLCASLI